MSALAVHVLTSATQILTMLAETPKGKQELQSILPQVHVHTYSITVTAVSDVCSSNDSQPVTVTAAHLMDHHIISITRLHIHHSPYIVPHMQLEGVIGERGGQGEVEVRAVDTARHVITWTP